ncbi:PadR family transcriptional regulator [Streptomyces sp. NPDC005548]|uniref:PadR family transcriptional regulator n=1 Tax=Streptomyces sp. NPDC005548 TaxID=3364724 RepID=UPI0036C9EAF9
MCAPDAAHRLQHSRRGGLSIGHLYQILDRLVRDGYVTRSQVAQSDRPDKNLYTLTPAGGAEVADWATTACVRTGGFRDEVFLKLLGAVALGTQALTTLVEAQRQTYLSELAGLAQQRRAHTDDPLVAFLIDAAIAHTKADAGLLDSAERHLSPLAAARSEHNRRQPVEPDRGPEHGTGTGGGKDQEREAWSDSA